VEIIITDRRAERYITAERLAFLSFAIKNQRFVKYVISITYSLSEIPKNYLKQSQGFNR